MTIQEFIKNHKNYKTALKSFALKLTKNVVDADDLVQEAMMKAFRSRHTFVKGSSFKSWSFTILKNCFVSRYRKRKRRAVVGEDISAFTFKIERNQSIRNEGESNLYIEEINACVDKLSQKVKVPFELFVEGYRYKEISEMLNIPIGTVKSRINFTRKKLQGMLEKKGIAA